MEEAKTIINVAGDYVQSKHVDYEINNVEAGGIGIQFVSNPKTTTTAATVRVRTPKLHTLPSPIAIGKNQQCQSLNFINVYFRLNGLHQTPTQMIFLQFSLEQILQRE